MYYNIGFKKHNALLANSGIVREISYVSVCGIVAEVCYGFDKSCRRFMLVYYNDYID